MTFFKELPLKKLAILLCCIIVLGTGNTVQAATRYHSSEIPSVQFLLLTHQTMVSPPYNCELAKVLRGETLLGYAAGLQSPWLGFSFAIEAPDNKEGPYKAIDSKRLNHLYCPKGTLDNMIKQGVVKPDDLVRVEPEASYVESLIISTINHAILVVAIVGNWIVMLASLLIAPLLGLRSFITHPMVTTGWPLLLGIANLGFMIALLFIAFATTLRIESMGARRMLPKLFIAAILINFSLIIAGVLLDASRVVMAIMVRGMTDGDLSGIGAAILKNSDVINVAFSSGSYGTLGLKIESTSWNSIFTVFQATLVIWVLAIGLIILTVSLLIRYIILILLLIVSPLAYLALAFPNADGIAKKWWGAFIKYVLYGPAALFVLILLIRLISSDMTIFNQPTGDVAFDNLLTVIIITVMCVAAVVAGKSFGTYGSAATMGFMSKHGKQLGKGATRLGLKTGVGAVGAGTGYIGRKTGFQPIKRTQAAYKGFMTERDKAKKREATTMQKQSRGTQVGRWAYGQVGATADEITQAKALKKAGTKTNPLADPAFTPRNLRSETVANALSTDQIKNIATATPAVNSPEAKRQDELLREIVSNKTIVDKLDATLIQDIELKLNERAAATLPPISLPAMPINLPTDTPEMRAEAQNRYTLRLAEYQHAMSKQSTSEGKSQEKFKELIKKLHDNLRDTDKPSNK